MHRQAVLAAVLLLCCLVGSRDLAGASSSLQLGNFSGGEKATMPGKKMEPQAAPASQASTGGKIKPINEVKQSRTRAAKAGLQVRLDFPLPRSCGRQIHTDGS